MEGSISGDDLPEPAEFEPGWKGERKTRSSDEKPGEKVVGGVATGKKRFRCLLSSSPQGPSGREDRLIRKSHSPQTLRATPVGRASFERPTSTGAGGLCPSSALRRRMSLTEKDETLARHLLTPSPESLLSNFSGQIMNLAEFLGRRVRRRRLRPCVFRETILDLLADNKIRDPINGKARGFY